MATNPSLIGIMSFTNPVFRAFLFYNSVLILKVLLSVLLIVRQRFRKLVFISPEDTVVTRGATLKTDDPDVERCRRAHQNDLENIPFFITASFIYMCTNPSPWLAQTLYLVYTASRILYTLIYAVLVLPQPSRALTWGVGYAIIIYMAAVSAIHFY